MIYVDFREIRALSPAAALVLAAELDRWSNILYRSRLRVVDVHEWDPNVCSLLNEMGFFDLLEVVGHGLPDASNKGDTQYVKFRSGRKVDGKAIDRLRSKDLEPIAGELPNPVRLYNAVTEAMTNVVQHAYQHQNRRAASWWLSASHDADGVTIMIYDQGSGIPETLPRNYGERLKERILGKSLLRDHAKMIKEAHELSRTRTDQPHRGHGLERDVRGYFKYIGEGYYRVTSQKGEYLVERSSDGIERETLTHHPHPLRGTLIEWRVGK
ncbi:ATP-binding protein [Candidatus Foliamicus sp.]